MRMGHGAFDRPIHKDGRPQLLPVSTGRSVTRRLNTLLNLSLAFGESGLPQCPSRPIPWLLTLEALKLNPISSPNRRTAVGCCVSSLSAHAGGPHASEPGTSYHDTSSTYSPPTLLLPVRSGQVRFITTRPKSRTMRATRQLMLPPSTVS